MSEQFTGFKESTLDERDIYFDQAKDHILGEDAEMNDYSEIYDFDDQGNTPTCAAHAITKLGEWVWYEHQNRRKHFSRGALYVQGNRFDNDPDDLHGGMSMRSALKAANKHGFVLEEKVPFGEPWYGESREEKYARWKEQVDALDPEMETMKIDYFRVSWWNRNHMMDVLSFQSPIAVSVRSYRGWRDGKAPEGRTKANHAAIVTKFVDMEWLEVVDSMRHSGDDNGVGIMHISNIYEAWGGSLKLDLADLADKKITDNYGVMTRYGYPKDFKAERRASALITHAISIHGNDQRVWEVYTKNMQMYINAVAYGGYNTNYFKWGRYYAGDIINQMYAEATGQKLPFDLNKLRNKQ